ncbi:MAG: GAF domain-containing protein [Chloroflexi bacterium]|nr:GAF domain-containing protein [Chloroflexota bacterium]MBU1751402.1 GAF domain-containing protein [Chloroflexota bacterium]MBU1879298.1 GAF domain-containing protein [Chloroflexota bacterium]
MFDRLFRRLTVRRRIVGGFVILLLLFAITIPIVMVDRLTLVGWLQQITEVEARVDRLLLLASTRITSSRVNLMRYADNYTPSAQESLTDVDRANQLLTEARGIITSPEQQADVDVVLEKLVEYKKLITDVQAARTEGKLQDVSQLLFQAYRLEGEIWQRIERVVSDSEARITAANASIYEEAQRRLQLLVVGYASLLIVSLILAFLVQRSITRPIAELRSGAEAFRLGHLDVNIPVVGTDELSLLALTFNQMAAQLGDLITGLEQRVAERTRELEQRSAYLEASAQVGHAATSILDTDALVRQMTDLIRERLGLYYVGLFLVDQTHEWAVLQAGTGEAGRAMLSRGHRIQVGQGMIGWCIANNQARIASRAEADAVRLNVSELPETRSEAALPLRSRDHVLGALTVQSDHSDAFDPSTIAVLQTMADQVAVALDNARLFAESQQALEAERLAYGQITHEAWSRMTQKQSDLSYLCDIEGLHPVRDQWRIEMVQASQESQTMQPDGATLVIPVRVREHVVGAIRLRKPDGAVGWTAEEIGLMETLTDQLGVALEGARLYQDSQRRAARERLTTEITNRMRETLDMDTVLQTAIREMGQALGIPRITVRLGSAEPPADAPAEGSLHHARSL